MSGGDNVGVPGAPHARIVSPRHHGRVQLARRGDDEAVRRALGHLGTNKAITPEERELQRINRRAHGGPKGENISVDKWAALDAQALLDASADPAVRATGVFNGFHTTALDVARSSDRREVAAVLGEAD